MLKKLCRKIELCEQTIETFVLTLMEKGGLEYDGRESNLLWKVSVVEIVSIVATGGGFGPAYMETVIVPKISIMVKKRKVNLVIVPGPCI